MTNQSGLEFLNRLYKDLHNSEIVMHTAEPSDTKNEKLEKYLNRLETITNRVYDDNRRTSSNDINLLKRYYYDKYVIKEYNIPESYFELQKKIALEEGRGYLEYTSEIKKLEIENIISEQKHSLDKWLNYFVSKETSHYPIWFKYYAFQGMLTLGQYDKKTNKFTKRTAQTTKPFIEINREAIAFIYSYLVKYFDKEEIDDNEIQKLLESGSFSKLYAYSLKKLDSLYKDNIKSDEGIWKKYDKGSNPEILFNDIYGKGTGWCTAGGIETATKHLNGGDFYVYYTRDKDGVYTNPRIAIRMEDNSIAEIRGIAENQNLETNMEEVVEKKLEEFPDKDTYKKKVNDMKMMTYIYTKFKNKVELTKEDLRFLYEIDNEIIGFGYGTDPRIEEIIKARNNERKDLAMLFSCKEEEIALNKTEALSGNFKCYRGSLYLGVFKSAKGLKLPSQISGNLDLRYLISVEYLELPSQIGGSLYLDSLISAKGLKLPSQIGVNLDLRGLRSAEGLELPSQIGGYLDLRGLTSAEGLELPSQIGGSLNLSGLASAEGLELPETIGGNFYCPLFNNDFEYAKEYLKKEKEVNKPKAI